MACITANLLLLHKMNPVGHSCRFHGLRMVLRFALSRSNVGWGFTGINHSEWPSKSCVWELKTLHSLLERTSADVCLKQSLGSYMKQTINFMSWCTVSIAMPNVVTVKTQMLLCSNRLRVPTLTWKMQRASMWSISCIIQHLIHQQRWHKIQSSRFQKRTFRHHWQANTSNRQSAPWDDVIKWTEAKAAWKQNGSEPVECCVACDAKRSLQQGNNEKRTSWAKKRGRNRSRMIWKGRLLWEESELMTQRQQLNRSRKIWEMLKRRDWWLPSLEQHLRRCWTPSEIVWAILQVPTMGRMEKTRMMMKKILRGTSLAKMTNSAGWWAQFLRRYSIAWSVFGTSRWCLTKWLN